MTIITPNTIDRNHLETVKAQMIDLGSPTIRVVDMGEDCYVALEGSHRIMAACELGVEPYFEEIEYSNEEITIQWDGEDETVIISEIADLIYANANRSHIVKF